METDLNERESPPCRTEIYRLAGENRELVEQVFELNREVARLRFEIGNLMKGNENEITI